MKFKFEVLLPEEVRMAREIIKEKITMSVNICRELSKQSMPEIPSEESEAMSKRADQAFKDAKKYQAVLEQFDIDYLNYLTSEMKKLPEMECIMEDPDDRAPAWKGA